MTTPPARKPALRMSEAERKKASEKAVAEHVANESQVDFFESGDTPAPGGIAFIGEDEENDPDAVERNKGNGQ